MISVVTFKWGKKFSADDVNRLAVQVRNNLARPHKFVCFTDNPEGIHDWIVTRPLWGDYLDFSDGCYARLKLFGKEGRELVGSDAFLWLDLDALIVGSLDGIVDELMGHNVALARGLHFLPIINGSFVWNITGTETDVWEKFDLGLAHEIATTSYRQYLGTDQSWLDYMLPDAHKIGPQQGIWAYGKSPGWPMDGSLPDNARIVFFPGKLHTVEKAKEQSPWIERYLT